MSRTLKRFNDLEISYIYSLVNAKEALKTVSLENYFFVLVGKYHWLQAKDFILVLAGKFTHSDSSSFSVKMVKAATSFWKWTLCPWSVITDKNSFLH